MLACTALIKTDNLGPRPEYKLEGTPIMVKGVLYTTAGTRRSVVALDAKTGELIWSHSVREGARRFLMMADDLHEAYEVPCNGGTDGKV